MKVVSILLVAALVCFCLPAKAQRTGSYDTTISFMGSNRAVSVFVPSSYSPSVKYRLIVGLHGLGDTCFNYRNALINTAGWGTGFGNTIFIFPEAANRNADFYLPTGGEGIIPQSVAFMTAQYHVDTQNIILQGFSLGGRAALRYGLDHPNDFKGLLLTTPAVQGVKEALNGHAATYSFNYSNASKIPMYMFLGDQDIAYQPVLDSVFEQLNLNDGIVRFQVIPGMGHQVPNISYLQSAIAFINQPKHAGADAEVLKIYDAPWICNASNAAPRLLLRNSGTDTLHAIRYHYSLGGNSYNQTWTGTLAPFQHAIVPLNVTNATAGDNLLSAQIDSLNSNLADTVLGNNQISHIFSLPATAVSSISEGFEGPDFPPSGWLRELAGDFWSGWADDNTIAKDGSNSANAFNTILLFDNKGRSEGLVTPPVDLSGIASPVLRFDLCFVYHRYTPPYLSTTMDFADTLEVLASRDCGAHYTSLFRKGGADLSTFANPILNPLNYDDLFLTPADSNWRQVTLNLSALAGSGDPVMLKFNYISDLGGSVNLDNIYVGTSLATSETRASQLQIFPNPAHDAVVIEAGNQTLSSVELLDLTGKLIATQDAPEKAGNRLQLDLHSVPAGLYMIRVHGSNGVVIRKLSVVK